MSIHARRYPSDGARQPTRSATWRFRSGVPLPGQARCVPGNPPHRRMGLTATDRRSRHIDRPQGLLAGFKGPDRGPVVQRRAQWRALGGRASTMPGSPWKSTTRRAASVSPRFGSTATRGSPGGLGSIRRRLAERRRRRRTAATLASGPCSSRPACPTKPGDALPAMPAPAVDAPLAPRAGPLATGLRGRPNTRAMMAP